MTTYPNSLDSDLTLPRIENNVTEITADSINNIRDAVLAIEQTLGVNIQGNLQDLATRINKVIDDNGNIIPGALTGIGLVSLPIYDAQIATNANIQESKLALTYSTTALNTSINIVRSAVSAVQSGLNTTTNEINNHVLGIAYAHDGYQINIMGSGQPGGLAGLSTISTLGDAVNEIDGYLIGGISTITPHLELDLAAPLKHAAQNIFVDTSSFTSINSAAQDVQSALNDIDLNKPLTLHTEDFHSPGIFKEVASGISYNARQQIIPASAISYTGGYDGYGIVTFTSLPSFVGYSFSTGDILVVQSGSLDAGFYQINAIGPLTNPDILGNLPALNANQLTVFHIFQETTTATAQIFKSAFVSTDSAPLACATRDNGSIADTISILHPQAARVKSIGFDGTILAADGYHLGISVGIGGGNFRSIDIPNLNLERDSLTPANPVTSKTVADWIDAYVSSTQPGYNFHFPITAYRVGDELVIAHNWVGPEYTIEILDGYSGNFALGLDSYGANVVGVVVYGSLGSNYSVNGKQLNDLETIFDGYAISNGSGTNLSLYQSSGSSVTDILNYGIVSGSVLQVSNHININANGSYAVLNSSDTSISLLESIPVGTAFDVLVSAADVSLAILGDAVSTNSGLVQIYVDSNQNTLLNQRLVFKNTFGPAIEIVNVSSGFPIGDALISIDMGISNDYFITSDTLSGVLVTTNPNFVGSFKLYHPNNLDYVTIDVDPSRGPFIGIDNVQFTVYAQLPEDEALLLCAAFFNGELKITNINDKRLFGNIGISKVRDDFTGFLSQSTEELRTDGVVRGFDLAQAEYIASITGMVAVPLVGGIAYVNGVRIATDTQKVSIQSFDSLGNPITGTKILGLNEFGTIQEMNYDLTTLLIDGYETIFGRVLPLYAVTLTAGLINNTLTDIIDIRRFINTIDNKIELVVDGAQDNMIGSFTTLEGALLYVKNYPSNEKLAIRLINTVYPNAPLVVPDGVSIIGSIPYGGTKQQIINLSLSSAPFITLMGNNRLENIRILATSFVNNSLVNINGSNVRIEKCFLGFQGTIGSNMNSVGISISSLAIQNVEIIDNIIDTVYSGIYSYTTVQNLLIDGNKISNVSGVGGGDFSCGVRIRLNNQADATIDISNNKVSVTSSNFADLRGILIEMYDSNNIDTLKITNNSIGSSSLTNGINISVDTATGIIDKLVVTNNIINGINYFGTNIYGIYCAAANHVFINNNFVVSSGSSSPSNYGIYVEGGYLFAEVKNNTIKDCLFSSGIYIAPTGISPSNPIVIDSNNLINVGSGVGIEINCLQSSISNNIINCSSMSQLIYTFGAGHAISSNHLINTTNNGTRAILIGDAGGIVGLSIVGNLFDGNMDYAIYGGGTSFSSCTINSNSSVLSTNSIYLPNATNTCLIVGNNFVSGSGTIGSAQHFGNIGV